LAGRLVILKIKVEVMKMETI